MPSSPSDDNLDAWSALSHDYKRARAKPDSLDTLVEWPAQRLALGDVTGLSILDVGCGDGSKVAGLVRAGAVDSVGVDVRDDLLVSPPAGLTLTQGSISALEDVPALVGRQFDRILFLQSFGYADDPVAALKTAKRMLAEDGFILLTRTQPVRYALERAEQNRTALGDEYFASGQRTYRSNWNEDIALTKRTYTMSDLLNTFSDAGLWIEQTWEPQLSPDDAAQAGLDGQVPRHPHVPPATAPLTERQDLCRLPVQSSGMLKPQLRASTEAGQGYDDPSEDALFLILEDIESGEGTWVIVERLADPSHQTYVQSIRNDDGTYVVEHRAGNADQHYTTTVADMREAHALLTAWAFELPGWEDSAEWQRLVL